MHFWRRGYGYGDLASRYSIQRCSDSVLVEVKFPGREGSLVIESCRNARNVFLRRAALMQDLTQPQHINTV